MARTSTLDRVIDGVQENGTVLIDLARTGNDRMYRFNRLLIEEAQHTQEDTSALLRQFVTAPTQVTEFTNSLFQTLSQQSRRRLDLAKTVVNDLRDATVETRSSIGRAAEANREALQATAEAGRSAAGRVVREAASAVESVADRAETVADDLNGEAAKPKAPAAARRTRRSNHRS